MLTDRFARLKPVYEIHSASLNRRDECLLNLGKITNIVAKSDMFKIYENVSESFAKLDKEFVECRRTMSVTATYHKLKEDFDAAADTFEQYLMFALLLQK